MTSKPIFYIYCFASSLIPFYLPTNVPLRRPRCPSSNNPPWCQICLYNPVLGQWVKSSDQMFRIPRLASFYSFQLVFFCQHILRKRQQPPFSSPSSFYPLPWGCSPLEKAGTLWIFWLVWWGVLLIWLHTEICFTRGGRWFVFLVIEYFQGRRIGKNSHIFPFFLNESVPCPSFAHLSYCPKMTPIPPLRPIVTDWRPVSSAFSWWALKRTRADHSLFIKG